MARLSDVETLRKQARHYVESGSCPYPHVINSLVNNTVDIIVGEHRIHSATNISRFPGEELKPRSQWAYTILAAALAAATGKAVESG